MIYHVSTPDEWASAQRDGALRSSTRDQSLEDVGFIHCSRLDQVAGVLQAYYAGAGPLLLLTIDEALLSAEWRDDEVATGVFFPHVYGPVNLDAVVAVTALEETPDGGYVLP